MASLSLPRGLIWLMTVLALVAWLYAAIMIDPVVKDTGEHAQTPRELAAIERVRERALWAIDNGSKPDGEWKRDAHPGPHGCVTAQFIVDDDVPEALRHGVLATPGARFDAWVRFSNGLTYDDSALDARGMAVKLMGVPGRKLLPGAEHEQTQDFVMINHHTFPIDDVYEFVDFFDAQVAGDNFGYFIGFDPFEWHLREMRVGLGLLKRQPSPLAWRYFSMLPYRLGPDTAIKFSMMPCDPQIEDACEAWKPNESYEVTETYLRDALVKTLTPKPQRSPNDDTPAARFAFGVQVQVPDANMPIEHASIEWSQDISPYRRVAMLHIPPQRFDSERQNEFCENLSFNPWHALPAHEPIGNLNRARFVLYDAVSKHRHAENGVARHEPRGFCLRLDGQPCTPGDGGDS